MQKSILRFTFLLATLFVTNQALSFVQIGSVTENNPPFNNCSISYLNVDGTLGGANYTYMGTSVSVVGFNITVDIEYSVGGIVLPAITPFAHVVDLGILPAGVYSITTNGIMNGALSSTMATSSTVTSCCNAIPSFTSNETNICVGDSIFLTNTSTGTTSQTWYANNVQVGTGFNYAAVGSSQGTIVYKLVVTDGMCSDSTEYAVNVYDAPIISSIIPSSSIVCEGESITFVGNATGAFSYSWYKDNVYAGGGNNFTTTATGAGIHTYMLIVLSACADTMETTVEFLAPPTFDSFTVSDDSLCLGETVSFTSTTTGSTVETWYENNVMIGSGNNISATPTASGAYSYNLTITDGVCTDSTVQLVQVLDLPTVYLGPDTNSCSGAITLDAGAGMASYEWQDLSTNQTIVADSGTYYVTVTDLFGCEATDTIEVATCASIDEFGFNPIKVSPNPTASELTFDLGQSYSNVELQILDVSGKVIFESTYIGIESIQLDLGDYECGSYFALLEMDGIRSFVKVLKQ